MSHSTFSTTGAIVQYNLLSEYTPAKNSGGLLQYEPQVRGGDTAGEKREEGTGLCWDLGCRDGVNLFDIITSHISRYTDKIKDIYVIDNNNIQEL